MSISPDIVFIDIETTGLSPLHQITEIAYAQGENEPKTLIPAHSLENASSRGLSISQYYQRGLDDQSRWSSEEEFNEFFEGLKNKTLCGANVRFDALRLALRYCHNDLNHFVEPWHHRPIDVSAMAMTVFGWRKPPGLFTITSTLRNMGYDITVPDHSAAADVKCTRDVYYALFKESGHDLENLV